MFTKKQRFWSVPSYRGLTIRRLALCVGLVVFVAWSNTWAQSPDPDADVNSAPPKRQTITLANPGPQSVTIRDRSGKSVKLRPDRGENLDVAAPLRRDVLERQHSHGLENKVHFQVRAIMSSASPRARSRWHRRTLCSRIWERAPPRLRVPTEKHIS